MIKQQCSIALKHTERTKEVKRVLKDCTGDFGVNVTEAKVIRVAGTSISKNASIRSGCRQACKSFSLSVTGVGVPRPLWMGLVILCAKRKQVFVCLFVCLIDWLVAWLFGWFFETGFLCVVLAVLGLTL